MRQVDLPSQLKLALLPVPLSIAEMNGTLHTGNKQVLVNVITAGINCPEAIELHKHYLALSLMDKHSW